MSELVSEIIPPKPWYIAADGATYIGITISASGQPIPWQSITAGKTWTGLEPLYEHPAPPGVEPTEPPYDE